MKMSATSLRFWSAAAFLLICLNLNLSEVASAPSKDSIFLNALRAPTTSSDDRDSDSEPPRTNSRRIRSVFSVPVKPQSDCPEGSRRVTETGECVEVAPDIKGGGDKFLIDSLKNFYRSTTRKPPRRRRTTTTTTTTTPGPGSISGSGFKTTTRSGQGDELTTMLLTDAELPMTTVLDPAPTPTDQTVPPTTTTAEAEEEVPTTITSQ